MSFDIKNFVSYRGNAGMEFFMENNR